MRYVLLPHSYQEAARLDTRRFTSCVVPWSTTSGSVLLLRPLVRIVLNLELELMRGAHTPTRCISSSMLHKAQLV